MDDVLFDIYKIELSKNLLVLLVHFINIISLIFLSLSQISSIFFFLLLINSSLLVEVFAILSCY